MKNKTYQILVLLWTIVQAIFFIAFLVFNGVLIKQQFEGTNSPETIAFVVIVSIIIFVVGSIIDMAIRKITTPNKFVAFILTTIAGPFRLPAQIFTLVQLARKDDDLFERGEYKPYFLNSCWYILFNHDHEEMLVSSSAKANMERNRQKQEESRARAAANEARREREMEYLKQNISACNIKLVAFGSTEGDSNKYWDAKFMNRRFIEENYWNKETGVGGPYDASYRDKSSWGTYYQSFYITKVVVDGVRINSQCFSNHLNFSLKPGTHNVSVTFTFVASHRGWESIASDGLDYMPDSDRMAKEKAGRIINKTVSTTVNVQSGYRYHLALFSKNYPTWIEYTHRSSGRRLYRERSDIKFFTAFEVMGERDVMRLANVGYIDPGLTLEQVNR